MIFFKTFISIAILGSVLTTEKAIEKRGKKRKNRPSESSKQEANKKLSKLIIGLWSSVSFLFELQMYKTKKYKRPN